MEEDAFGCYFKKTNIISINKDVSDINSEINCIKTEIQIDKGNERSGQDGK